MAGEWTDRDAVAMVVYGPAGAFVAFARAGGDKWQETRVPMGGAPPEQSQGEKITDLIEALRGPLGASQPPETDA